MPVTITKQPIVGKSSVSDKIGSVVESEDKQGEVTKIEGEMANVGISLGYTKNLGNYVSAKVTVSMHLPCDPSVEACDAALSTAEEWANKKMEEIVSQL